MTLVRFHAVHRLPSRFPEGITFVSGNRIETEHLECRHAWKIYGLKCCLLYIQGFRGDKPDIDMKDCGVSLRGTFD